ncbi:MAG: DUF6046 domain-containing protein [Bacteroidales bacterium]
MQKLNKIMDPERRLFRVPFKYTPQPKLSNKIGLQYITPKYLSNFIPTIRLDQSVQSQIKRQKRIMIGVAKSVVKKEVMRLISPQNKHSKLTIDKDYIETNPILSEETKQKYRDLPDSGTQVDLLSDTHEPKTKVYGHFNELAEEYLCIGYKNKDGKVIQITDPHAFIDVNQRKNILLTQVVGRNKTRKEFISGGDYSIKISGKIVSKVRGEYPSDEVSKLIEVLNHDGTISLESPYLSHFGIDGMIILDFSIPQNKSFRNVQEYFITGVYESSIEVLRFEEEERQRQVKSALDKINNKLKKDSGWVTVGDIKKFINLETTVNTVLSNKSNWIK